MTEAETYSKYIRGQLAGIRDALAGMSEEQLNWQPPLPGSNSLFVITSHVLGNARAFVLGIACGQTMQRDRPAEFASRGSLADVAAAVDKTASEIEAALAAITPSRLEERVSPPQELWGGGHAREIFVREALAHALEHAATHAGHIQMTCDIVLRHVPS